MMHCANDDLLCNRSRRGSDAIYQFSGWYFSSHICETEIRLVLDFIVKDVWKEYLQISA